MRHVSGFGIGGFGMLRDCLEYTRFRYFWVVLSGLQARRISDQGFDFPSCCLNDQLFKFHNDLALEVVRVSW